MDAELYKLLTELGRAGYMVHTYQIHQALPNVVAAVRVWDGCADVVIIYADDCAYACRTPAGPGRDVLDPSEVYWQVAGMPARALGDLLALAAPGHEGAPKALTPVMKGFGLPAGKRGMPARLRLRSSR